MSDRRPPTRAVRAAAVAALLEGGWIFLGGAHRLVTGDYIRLRKSLGPWADVVSEAGIDPLSLGALFLVLGLGIGIGGVGLLGGRRWAWSWAVVFAICTLWILPVGTLFSLAVLALLLLPRTRAAFRHAA